MRPVMTMKTVHDSIGRRLEGLDDDREGKFHGWGSGYEEFESGPGNYTVAIVEFPDGKVDTVMPYLIASSTATTPTTRRWITHWPIP